MSEPMADQSRCDACHRILRRDVALHDARRATIEEVRARVKTLAVGDDQWWGWRGAVLALLRQLDEDSVP